jgi:hypothetical protein
MPEIYNSPRASADLSAGPGPRDESGEPAVVLSDVKPGSVAAGAGIAPLKPGLQLGFVNGEAVRRPHLPTQCLGADLMRRHPKRLPGGAPGWPAGAREGVRGGYRRDPVGEAGLPLAATSGQVCSRIRHPTKWLGGAAA